MLAYVGIILCVVKRVAITKRMAKLMRLSRRPVPAALLALPRARFLCSGGKSNALATGQLTNERGEVSGFTCTYAAAGLGGFSPRLLASPKMINAIISLRRPG